ncbi:MAG: winged helix-turn-helix transcriptional regulator [Anaerolineae bacterium]|nr:winged helix-turn-helix transcriptional regulator [Anaerolineae bacterium]
MDEEILELAKQRATVCRIFGNPTRVLILWALMKRELSVGEVAATVDASLPNTSQHLRLMQDRGILASRKEGNAVYYHILYSDLINGCRLLLVEEERNSRLSTRRKQNDYH